jgi:hypothetical protein
MMDRREGADAGSGRRVALVVAIDRYDRAALHRLAAPGADAEALAEVLGDPDLGGFEVEILRNPTSSRLAERVERTLVERKPADLVVLHFSGHGLKDDAGELHLAATNTVPELLGSTAVDAAWVSRMMQRSRAQRVVLLLDCCYGGAFERGLLRRARKTVDVGDRFGQPQLAEGRGRVVITASTAMEYAFEDAELTDGAVARPAIFTGALAEGIRTGEADRDQDGQISLAELYDFVYDRVRKRTPHQTPSKWEFGVRGDIYLAQSPKRQVTAVSPPPVGPRRRPKPAVLATVLAILVLAAGVTIAAVVANGRKGAPTTSPSSGASPPASAYAMLMNRVPSTIRPGCTEGKPKFGEVAVASCTPGKYQLWPSLAKLKEDFDNYGSSPRKGSCATPPADARRVDALFPQDRSGQLSCWLFPKDDDNEEAYYAIEWAVHSALVTGTFFTDDTDPNSYAQQYAEALKALRQMP